MSQKLVSNSTFGESGLGNLTKDGSTTPEDRIWWDDYSEEAPLPEQKPKLADPSAPQPKAGSRAVDIISKTAANLGKELTQYMRILFPLPFILVGAIGFITAPWTKGRAKRDFYLLSFVACTFIGYAATVTEVRYFYALMPIMIGWVSLGCVNIGRFITKHLQNWRNIPRVTPVVIQISLLLFLIASLTPLFSLEFETRGIDNVPYEEKAAGLWLRHNSDSHSLVMTPDARVAFYAGARHVFLPDEDVRTIGEYADRKKVTHIVLSERRLKHRQSVYRLGDRDVANLELVYDDTVSAGYNVKIYKVPE